MRRRSGFVALLVAGAILGVPGQAPAAEPIHPTVAADVALGRPSNGFVDARLPWRANMVGVSFPGLGEAEVDVELRAHDGKKWTPWTELDAHGEHAPDGAEAVRAAALAVADRSTEAVWVGASKRVQVRVRAPRGVPTPAVKLHALNTAGDAHEVSIATRVVRSVGRFLSRQPQRAEAISSTPRIITRAQWGGSAYTKRPSGFAGYASEVKMVFLHHTDNPNSYSKSQSAAIVRGIHRYHTRTRGFADIGYNLLIDRYGQIFEGRWGGVRSAVIGAHTLGFNRYSTGIALIGSYGRYTPPRAAQTWLKRLLAWKMDVHHIPVKGTVVMRSSGNERYRAGALVRFNRISGHRNAKPTACPGARAYNLLPSLRTGADAIGHPKIILPRVLTSTGLNTVRADGDGVDEYARFRAYFTRTVNWKLRLFGPLARSFEGTGTSMDVIWRPGFDSPVPSTGRYTWRLDAQLSSGTIAMPAIGRVYVVTDYPSGTLLADGDGAFVVGASPTRKDATAVTRKAMLGSLRAVATGPSVRERAPVAMALPIREGTLLRGPDLSRYIFSSGTLRRFVNNDVFTQLGYSTDALVSADQETISAQPAGPLVEDVTRHPDGTAVTAGGQHWVIEGGVRRPIDELALLSRYRPSEVVPAASGDLELDLASPVDMREGTLLDGPGNWSYVYSGGTVRRFRDNVLFGRMGFSWSMRLPVTQQQLDALPAGEIYG